MNRRNFLKRLAVVAAGAVAVPTIAKRLTCRPGLQKYDSILYNGRTIFYGKPVPQQLWLASRHAIVWDEFESKQGRYRREHMDILRGEYYANNSKNNLRHTA